jgi:hypothetical protein
LWCEPWILIYLLLMKTVIYYLCKEDGIPFYIGKTNDTNQRKYNHRRKYGSNILLEILDEVNKEDWRFWEKYYIFLFKSWGFKLTNQNNGGGGLTTIKFSEERNKKISIANKNKSKSHKGRLFTDEHKAKIKAKREYLKNRKNDWQNIPILQYNIQMDLIKEWNSQKEAQISFNKPKSDGIGAVCRGKQKTAYGYIWKFKNNNI